MLCVQTGSIMISFPKHTKIARCVNFPKAIATLAFMQRDCKGDTVRG